MKKGGLVFLAVIIVLIAVGVWAIYQFDGGDEDDELYCESDADCVPASCCHPFSCVNAGAAPDCSGVFCTQECRPGSLDCGQGSCSCVNNKCGAVFE